MSNGSTFGVLVPLVSGPYFGAVLTGIAKEAAARNGRALVLQTLDAALGDDYTGVPSLTEHVGWDQVDGLIVVTNAAYDGFVRAFHATGKPLVLLSHSVQGLSVPHVSPDNRGGVSEVVAHLVEHGHTRIAFAGFPSQHDLHERYQAYRLAMLAHGLDPSPGLFFDTGNSLEVGGYDAGRAMLTAGMPSTAVIAGNDLNAIGLMRALREGGCALPRDQAVAGFDDSAPAQYQNPSLTTVNQHVRQVGAVAVDLLDRLIAGETVDASTRIVAGSLVIRGSCGCAAGGARTGSARAAALHVPPIPEGAQAVGHVADALLQVIDVPDVDARTDMVEATRTVASALLAAASDADPAGETDDDAVPRLPGTLAAPDEATRSTDLLAAVDAIHRARPRGEAAAAVTTMLQRFARELAGSTPDTGRHERLDAVVREVALDFGAARAADETRTSRHLQRVLRAEHALSMGLLRGRAEAPDSLAWLADSPVHAACLGLWANSRPGGRELDIVSSFGDVDVPLGLTCPEDFPPRALIEAADRHPGSVAAVLAVKSNANDWGLLAIVGRPEFRTLSGRETYFAWAAMLGGALDYEVMLDSLRRQREDLALAYGRERSLTDTIRSSEERYALAAAAANDGLWDWNLTTDAIYYSTRWKALIGHTEDEVGTTPEEWLDRVHGAEAAALAQLIDACRTGASDDLEHEHRIRARDGTYRWVLCRALAIPGHGAPATRLVGSLTDITERHDLEEQLRRQALYDTLTGLPNRPLFLDRLDRAIARRRRGVPGHFAVAFLDLDGFKLVNDSLGHATGDALLEQAARRISAGLRRTDTAARIGGDEFTVLYEGLTSLSTLPTVVRRLQEAIGTPYEIDGHTLVVTASAGVATSAVEYDAPDDVLRDADIAMYRAKSREPGSFLVFDPSMRASVVSRLDTESRLRRAVDADELVLHYQPVVDLSSGRLIAMEGLIRWPQPDGRIALPGEFLTIAEESGLIVPMGRSVARQACQQIADWRADGLLPDLIPVSINVSHREFWRPELADHLMRTLRTHDLTPDWLVVEITEGVLMGNVPEAQRRLEELHCMGIALHIDDFGTGYSSLEALHQFPIDALKIDRSFVNRLESDPRSRELVSTIVAMARGLDIDVIAEGIETPAQQRLLLELGCTKGQGYLFARPTSALDLTPLLRRQSGTSDRART